MAAENARRFVREVYLTLLGREPEPENLDYLATALVDGTRTHEDVLRRCAASNEAKSRKPPALFVPPGHFYSPIVDPCEAERHLDARATEATLPRLAGIDIDRAGMVAVWHEMLPALTSVPFPEVKEETYRYAFDNPAYSWGDGAVLHAMIRRYRPKRIVEIGSGWSSACAVDTVQHYLGGDCALTFIEPYPELVRGLVAGYQGQVKFIEKPVQQVQLTLFDELEANDILFIDSTHVLRTGSDVHFELFDILPRLRPGVVVHIHDIFWPFEYGKEWAVIENRSWNEAYALRAFLTDNPNWKIIWFNDYFARFERQLIAETYPSFLRNSGGAIWLRREPARI